VTGDCHAGICGSLGARFPQATRPIVAFRRGAKTVRGSWHWLYSPDSRPPGPQQPGPWQPSRSTWQPAILPRFPTMDRHLPWWIAGATAMVAGAGLLVRRSDATIRHGRILSRQHSR
jgi:hypothetical protein